MFDILYLISIQESTQIQNYIDYFVFFICLLQFLRFPLLTLMYLTYHFIFILIYVYFS